MTVVPAAVLQVLRRLASALDPPRDRGQTAPGHPILPPASARTPAPTYTEPHWFTGRPKLRCAECHRVVFADEAAATARAAEIRERHPMRPVFGRCGHWHVTGSRPRRRRSPRVPSSGATAVRATHGR